MRKGLASGLKRLSGINLTSDVRRERNHDQYIQVYRYMQPNLHTQSNGSVKRINEKEYVVTSQSNGGSYRIHSTELGWVCSCPDHVYRGVKCKHIHAVEFSFALRQQVKKEMVIQPINSIACRFCASENIVKKAIRRNKQNNIQRYLWKGCGKRYSFNIGFDRMHATPQIITSALQLYFTGESLRNVQKFLKLQGVKISHIAIYKWINKYVGLMQAYLDKVTPNVADTWRADELYLKVRGNPKYLYALMDDQTRFWIAQQVPDTKYTSNIQPLLRHAKEIACKRPNTFITDGAANFHDAFNKEFFTLNNPRTRHISHIRLQGDHNNNKMERMNGEVRDREKVMRGLKRADTAVLTGYQTYHNYFRPHEALKGKTPAEKYKIIIEGENKWKTVIENASREKWV